MSGVPKDRASLQGVGDEYFAVRVHREANRDVVVLSGELDLASGSAAASACTATDHVHVVVNLADLEFMDSASYRALVTARAILEPRGGSLVLTDAVGEPRRLLALIEQDEVDPASLLPYVSAAPIAPLPERL